MSGCRGFPRGNREMPSRPAANYQLIKFLDLPEPAPPRSELHRVDARVGNRQPGIRYMLETRIDGKGLTGANEDMKAHGSVGQKIHGGCPHRHLGVSKQYAAPQLEIGNGMR